MQSVLVAAHAGLLSIAQLAAEKNFQPMIFSYHFEYPVLSKCLFRKPDSITEKFLAFQSEILAHLRG